MDRDYYQGVPELDMRLGMGAGPWGDPNRYGNAGWGNMTIWDTLDGTFPRSISLFRYVCVMQTCRSLTVDKDGRAG